MDIAVKTVVDVLNKEDCKATRSMWEEVFYEDSMQFVDYYYEHKAEKNIGYVIGEAPYHAMMFRTPYQLHIGNQQREISYLVGVATREKYRHRGCMRRLLMHSFREMYEEKQPFTFLMPANPSIYEPFDFRYIYERDVWKLKDDIEIDRLLKESQLYWHELKAAEIQNNDKKDDKLEGWYRVSSLQEQFSDISILEIIANFANEYLKKHYNIYVHRDEAYYEMQMKELAAQNGDIYVLFEQGEIKVFFLYAKEEEVFIQEVVGEEGDIPDFLQREETKKPIIMARIIHLEEMLKLVCSKEHRKLTIEIEDDLIPENTGTYDWEITPNGSKITKIQFDRDRENCELKAAQMGQQEEGIEKISMHIRELAPYILRNVFINEIV